MSEPKKPFETVYNVSLDCESCIENVTKAVEKLGNIKDINCDIGKQKVSVLGSQPPSKIIEAIQSTGRDAIIRGTGKLNSAAVCILERFDKFDRQVNGLARLVSIDKNETFIDLTLTGVETGTYFASFRESGDLSDGPLSTGKSILTLPKIETNDKRNCSDLGNGTFKCQQFVNVPLNITDIIGRSITVSRDPVKVFLDSMCGVIARSAGAWENEKYVCSCTGKNIWDERKAAVESGIN